MKSKSALRLSGSSDDVPGLTTQASLKKVGRRSPLLAIPIFAIVLSILVWEFYSFPALDANDRAKVRIPRSLEDAKTLRSVFAAYTTTHYWTVIGFYCLVYLTLQTFCIPGTVFLSFLAGALFGFWVGFILAVLMATAGASSCYLLSSLIGHGIIHRFFPERAAWFRKEVVKHHKHIFNYLLFLRISPLLPNWFVNLTSPIIGVPFSSFAVATFFGVMPATFLTVRAGLTLQKLQSTSDVIDLKALLSLFALAFIPLLPTLKPVQNLIGKIFHVQSNEKQKENENEKLKQKRK